MSPTVSVCVSSFFSFLTFAKNKVGLCLVIDGYLNPWTCNQKYSTKFTAIKYRNNKSNETIPILHFYALTCPTYLPEPNPSHLFTFQQVPGAYYISTDWQMRLLQHIVNPRTTILEFMHLQWTRNFHRNFASTFLIEHFTFAIWCGRVDIKLLMPF